MSTQHMQQHLTVNEKVQTADRGLIKSKNGGSPCYIDGLRVLETDAARTTPNGSRSRQKVIRAPSGQDAQQPGRAPSDWEGAKQP